MKMTALNACGLFIAGFFTRSAVVFWIAGEALFGWLLLAGVALLLLTIFLTPPSARPGI